MKHLAKALLLWLALLLAACQPQPGVSFHAQADPPDLAAWHLFSHQDGFLKLNNGVLPYGVNSKLFADYSWKLRTVWMPAGSSARYRAQGPFDFPLGTIISKTFYYPLASEGEPGQVALTYEDQGEWVPGKGLRLADVRLVETRLLVRREQGWHLVTYVWNEAQTAAQRSTVGALRDMVLVDAEGRAQPFTYVVPTQMDCATCHNHILQPTQADSPRMQVPIGPTAAHLHRAFTYADGTEGQLQRWVKMGYLTGLRGLAEVPRAADWLDDSQPLDARARSYLDANCAYCHNPHGEANYTALWLALEQPDLRKLGHCKTPVAAGPATGGRLFDIVPGQPHASILTYRMATDEVGKMMPELGRTLADRKGVELIRAWVASLEGHCDIDYGRSASSPVALR